MWRVTKISFISEPMFGCFKPPFCKGGAARVKSSIELQGDSIMFQGVSAGVTAPVPVLCICSFARLLVVQ